MAQDPPPRELFVFFKVFSSRLTGSRDPQASGVGQALWGLGPPKPFHADFTRFSIHPHRCFHGLRAGRSLPFGGKRGENGMSGG